MTAKMKQRWILAAAVGLCAPAWGQYATNNDGRALDANNRVGSGGYNQGGGPTGPLVTPNQIVTGNVTGGREFRGFAATPEKTEFRGVTGGGVADRFIRDSSGAPYGNSAANNMLQPRPFYGESRAAPPPPGYALDPVHGTYVPVAQPRNTTVAGDSRINDSFNDNFSTPQIVLPKPGEMVLPGPVDPTAGLTTASPVYGVRTWKPGETPTNPTFDAMRPGGQLSAADSQRVKQMRQELQSSAQTTDNQSQPLNAMENPNNAALGESTGGSSLNSGALGGDISTDQGYRNRLLLPTAAQQSSQVAELQKRLNQSRGTPTMSDEEAARQFNAQMRQRNNPDNQTAPGPAGRAPVPGAMPPPANPQPKDNTPEQKTAAPRRSERPVHPGVQRARNAQLGESYRAATQQSSQSLTPLTVKSLADGVRAEGLRNTLLKAEALMKDGKYTSALDQYELAERAAPNNPMLRLGRANAELGAAYYALALKHLAEAFSQEPALLMGQYDLKSMLGEDRLNYVVRDLKETAKNEPTVATPLVLLAYISYNTGAERMAGAYLEAAEQRSGAPTALIRLLKQNWAIPAEQNK